MDREQSVLCVIDIQERLVPAILSAQVVIESSIKLIEAAAALSVPIICSEQYPKGLGHTVDRVASPLPDGTVFAKTHFSCADDRDIEHCLGATGRRQVIICGMEAHVCVLQSALGFQAQGFDVFVVRDAISSRTADSKQAALERLSAAGVALVTVEMVLFEWLHQAGTAEFRQLRHLVS